QPTTPAAPPTTPGKPTTPPPAVPTPANPSTIPITPAPRSEMPVVAPEPALTPYQVDVNAYPQTPLVGSATIKKIVVEENEKTDDDTVIVISKLEVGDRFSADMAEGVRNELISSGLFKDVLVYWTTVEGGVQVHLVVKDKHSWVIAPAFYTQPTNVGGGVGFGENNLFGLNQKLLIYGQIATGDSFFIGAWVIPNIAGTRFYAQVDTYLKSSRNIEYNAPTSYISHDARAGANPKAVRESRIHYLNTGFRLGMELFRGFKVDTRLRAAKVSFKDVKLADGASIEEVTGDPTSDPTMVPAPGGEGWDVSNEWSVSIDRRANYYGIQSGYRYAATLEHSLESLDSDFKYYVAGLSVFRAKKILDRHNLILRANLGRGKNVPFQQEFQTGGTSMRGWLNNQFRGDFKASATVEYSLPIMPTIKGLSIRGLAFWDSAYTTFITTREAESNRHYLPDSEARGLKPFKNSVGVGTRLYLRQIVLPLLGLDLGYGLEARDFQVYLAIGLTD
nr:BamA/TamA family outer membrane protein [Myxococcota bacterium]